VPANVKVANPDLVIANLTKGTKISAKMEVESGTGWQSAEEGESAKIGEIPLDATFSPVLLVNYKVEETRVGRLTNYDKLTMEITTDGTITPKEALVKAAQTFSLYLNQVISPKKVKEEPKKSKEDGLGAVGRLSVEEIGLPTRVANALVKTGYETVEKLVKADRAELMKVRNLGEKSIKIIAAALGEKGVEF
jgi:DNA-directed RNA polymerase subunit alpha